VTSWAMPEPAPVASHDHSHTSDHTSAPGSEEHGHTG
jgi:hypothetical protein